MRNDILDGVITGNLTIRLAADKYNCCAQMCREIQHQLRKEGLLVQVGKRFRVADLEQVA